MKTETNTEIERRNKNKERWRARAICKLNEKSEASDNTIFTHRAFALGPDTKLEEDSEGHFSSREA